MFHAPVWDLPWWNREMHLGNSGYIRNKCWKLPFFPHIHSAETEWKWAIVNSTRAQSRRHAVISQGLGNTESAAHLLLVEFSLAPQRKCQHLELHEMSRSTQTTSRSVTAEKVQHANNKRKRKTHTHSQELLSNCASSGIRQEFCFIVAPVSQATDLLPVWLKRLPHLDTGALRPKQNLVCILSSHPEHLLSLTVELLLCPTLLLTDCLDVVFCLPQLSKASRVLFSWRSSQFILLGTSSHVCVNSVMYWCQYNTAGSNMVQTRPWGGPLDLLFFSLLFALNHSVQPNFDLSC